MNQKIILSIFLFAFLSLPVHTLSFENEPHGFRNLMWGVKYTDIQKDLAYSFTDERGEIKFFELKEEQFIFGDAELSAIYYGFCNGELCRIRIRTRGMDNCLALKKVLFSRHGSGLKLKEGICLERYYWFGGEDTSMTYENNTCSSNGILYIESKAETGR